MAGYVVVGSLNVDHVLTITRLPRAGETVEATAQAFVPGGKGANQAVALARLGASVAMVGAVGEDAFGGLLRDRLLAEGVDVKGVLVTSSPTGMATVLVSAEGESTIVVAAGANRLLTPDVVRERLQSLDAASTVVAQLEVPLETVGAAFRLARKAGARTVLDPAPADPSAASLLPWTDLCLPNRHEASVLTGVEVTDFDRAEEAARRILARGAGAVVVKLDRAGALFANRQKVVPVPAVPVHAVDATAAGDAFLAAFLEGEREGGLETALRWATRAGALAASRKGAQPSLPYRREIGP